MEIGKPLYNTQNGENTKKRKNKITSDLTDSKKIRRLSVGANSNGILKPPPSKFAKQVLQDEVSNRSESSAEQTDVKLNGDKDKIDVFAYASSSSSSDDEVTKLKYELKKISHNNKVNGAGDAMISSRLNGSIKGKLRNNVKKKGVNGADRNRKQKEDSAAVGSLKGECKDLVVADKNVFSSKRNSSNSRRRKMPGSGNVAKKGKSKEAGTCDIDPDDDLEQNAARMLSSRFDPSCTGFASKSRTLTLSSVNGDCPPEKPTDNVGGENDASADAAERVLRPRRHQKGKGDPRKTRHFYEIDPVDMDASWFLYKNIKIFWPIEESWYYGLVDKYDAEQKRYHIKFDDRDEEWISLENERFKVLLLPSEVPRTGKDDALKDNHTVDTNENKGEDMESEPIISWLARSSHRGKSSTSNSLKKQKLLHKSLDVCNSGNLGLLERETVSPHCGSSLLDASIDRLKNAMSVREKTNSSEGHPPIVYIRRRVRRYKKVARVTPWSLNDAGVLKLDTTFIKSKTFEICISLWPVLTHVLGVDMLWLIHSVLLLRYGTVVLMWPSVFLEVLFVDSIVGLRLFLFKGCLKQAVAFVFLVMEVFCEPERDKSNNQQVPVTSIRFKISLSQNFREQKIFSYYSFSKVSYSSWQHLDSEFRPHCSFTKQLSLPECTYDNIKLLEDGSQNLPLPSSGQTAFEGFRKKSNHGVVSMLGSSRLSIPGSRPSAIYSLKHGNLPPFALSFNAAPNFFLSLHLKLLLERSINSFSLHDHDSVHSFDPSEDTMHPHADDCSPLEISSESSSKSDESLSSLEAAGKDAALESVDGSQGNLTKLVFDGDFNVNRTSISSKAAQTVPINIENSDKCTGPSNLNGISVEIPTSEEIYRDSWRTPGSRQVSDLTWNLNDGIISSPNPTAPRSVWHRHKSGPSSSPFGDPSSSPFRDSLHSWADAKADYVGNGFGSGPKKPRTQVQYTLPSRDSSFKSKGHNQISLPYQRLRKANDKKTSDVSKGPRRNLELVACAANLLINSGDKGWRECGVRVFLEAADHNEWKLAVKCSGELKYIYKVHQDLPPGSSNRYTHAMIWKGGKDWSLEFPDRGQWILFKEMHEECHNRNIRASSIKNIPIPGVRLIEDLIDDQEVMPFVRGPWYFSQAKSDVERAMDASHVLYDMDNEDEEWVSGYRASCEMQGSKDDVISDELFEKVMDMLEKVSYAQKRDHFTPGEIEELIARVSPMQVGKSIYEYWREKRQCKGMPLIRQLQEPKGTEIPGLRMLATIPIYQDRQEILKKPSKINDNLILIATNWASSVGHQDSLGAWGGDVWLGEVSSSIPTGTFTPSGRIRGSTGGFRVTRKYRRVQGYEEVQAGSGYNILPNWMSLLDVNH
uniref:Enhancer of polycomb-like protein n=1 Tax=Tanacetum cinerariifolium TaxID=118510 RepID=A0A699HPS7_TANCI|nr:hypothetical protein [Tanacetum cinerariifolium]GEY24313.1 hypothetical protein [Tanacetum cinerariifolium]